MSGQLLHGGLNVPAALAFMLPLMAAGYAGVAGADSNAAFGEMRALFQTAIIPQLRAAPGGIAGLGLLALGAGVGEEVLFRAYLQAAAAGGIAASGLPEAAATAVALAGTSVVFGTLHALTPLYLVYATLAGALMGECAALLRYAAPPTRPLLNANLLLNATSTPSCCRRGVPTVWPAHGCVHAFCIRLGGPVVCHPAMGPAAARGLPKVTSTSDRARRLAGAADQALETAPIRERCSIRSI